MGLGIYSLNWTLYIAATSLGRETPLKVYGNLKGDLHSTTLSHATSLRLAYDTNCFV